MAQTLPASLCGQQRHLGLWLWYSMAKLCPTEDIAELAQLVGH